ncbi:hypothetical protein [Thermocladium modestius]|nr:hypothetical protein [Thermocladium modestius]
MKLMNCEDTYRYMPHESLPPYFKCWSMQGTRSINSLLKPS